MIVYMLECHSPKSSHPLPLPLSPKVHNGLFVTFKYRYPPLFLNFVLHHFAFMKYLHSCLFSVTERNLKWIFAFSKEVKSKNNIGFAVSHYRITDHQRRVAPPSSFLGATLSITALKPSRTLWSLPRSRLSCPLPHVFIKAKVSYTLPWVPEIKFNQRNEKMKKQRKTFKQDKIIIKSRTFNSLQGL